MRVENFQFLRGASVVEVPFVHLTSINKNVHKNSSVLFFLILELFQIVSPEP
jgi:hypothetical protein